MRPRSLALTVTAVALLAPIATAAKKPVQTAWGYAAAGEVKVFDGLAFHPKLLQTLGRGTLVAVYAEKEKSGKRWSEISTTKAATGEAALGWAESNQLKSFPLERFPANEDLFLRSGAPFTDDTVAADTVVTRLLLQQRAGPPLLVCLFESIGSPNVRLQVFTPDSNNYLAGPALEFPNAQIHSPVTKLAAQDAAGDGNECLTSHQPFSMGEQNQGVRLVVRRFEGGALKTLWTAPLESTNLSSFAAQPHKLAPPEKNVGAPGTVTKATVDFAANGGKPEIIWKATIEFHIFGREMPVDTLTVEKHCPWMGDRFEPIN